MPRYIYVAAPVGLVYGDTRDEQGPDPATPVEGLRRIDAGIGETDGQPTVSRLQSGNGRPGQSAGDVAVTTAIDDQGQRLLPSDDRGAIGGHPHSVGFVIGEFDIQQRLGRPGIERRRRSRRVSLRS